MFFDSGFEARHAKAGEGLERDVLGRCCGALSAEAFDREEMQDERGGQRIRRCSEETRAEPEDTTEACDDGRSVGYGRCSRRVASIVVIREKHSYRLVRPVKIALHGIGQQRKGPCGTGRTVVERQCGGVRKLTGRQIPHDLFAYRDGSDGGEDAADFEQLVDGIE